VKKDTPASDLERRKQLRLRLRADLNVKPQRYEGRTYYVVKDPVSMRYYRFKEHENFLLGLMDGKHTLDDAQKAFEKRFRPDRLTLEDLEQFGQQLLKAGLAQNESPAAGKQLWDGRKKRKRQELIQALTNILYIKIPIFDPERLLEKMLPYTRWMFTIWFLLLSIGVMSGALLLVLTHFQTFRDRWPSFHEFFSFKTIFYMWAALGVVKVIHEFGHGLSCKAFGGEVHEMGFLFLCFSPAMYCNVSDAWMLPSKWKRIIISGAGIYVELMIAAIATFVWWNSSSHPFINYMALCLMVVCSVSTVMFNGNPLMRYDGYYVLADWLEIPNLRDRANRYIQRLVMDHCLGIEVQPEPYMELWRRILFVTYAVTSYIYRWVITFVILKFMATFLKPYKLEVISNMLAVMAAGSMIGWPLYRLGKNLHKRGRVPDMKSIRVSISAGVLALILAGFFFLPLPVSRVRQTGLVQIKPDDIVQVHLEVPGILDKIKVKEGQEVNKGTVLAEFRSPELDNKEADSRTQFSIKNKLLLAYDKQLLDTRDPKERLQVQSNRKRAWEEREEARRQLEVLGESRRRLVLYAPRKGVVMGLPLTDELGKYWDKDQARAFCSVGDPRSLRILVPLSPDEYELVKENKKNDPPVSIRVIGRDTMTWQGKVSFWPVSEARDVPVALTNKGGGPLAVKPGSSAGQYAPQSQVYLVGIDFLPEGLDAAIYPGVLAQVKIHNEYRTGAWWVWRALSSTFDLGLM